MTESHNAPLVSVGIPLYRSAPFYDCITANLDALEDCDVEVLISDRHGIDDSLDRLEQRHGADPRFRFLRGSDELTWIEHCNLLLSEASGRYFVFMAHDDTFPEGYVSKLAACLEATPDAVLAFGRVEPIDLEGAPFPAHEFPPPPISDSEPWSVGALFRLCLGGLGLAFRGVIRREAVVGSGLYIRATRGACWADLYWLFGLGLKGRLSHVPEVSCRKRYFPGSTHARWPLGAREAVEGFRMLRSYLWDHAKGRRELLLGTGIAFCWMFARWGGARIPLSIKQPLRRAWLGLVRKSADNL